MAKPITTLSPRPDGFRYAQPILRTDKQARAVKELLHQQKTRTAPMEILKNAMLQKLRGAKIICFCWRFGLLDFVQFLRLWARMRTFLNIFQDWYSVKE
jgi:hypothetical protein